MLSVLSFIRATRSGTGLGDENSGYAYFKVADGIEGFALFVSDWMAPSVGNADKELPVGYREKSLVAFSVDNVDDTYRALKEKGVIFVNEPTDMVDWGAARYFCVILKII